MSPHELAQLALQFALLLLAAKLFGLLFKKIKQPEVLGELIGGMAIGPFALGAIELPWIGKLFPIAETVGEHASTLPIPPELYFVGQLGAVLLLFLVGLETDAKLFMRYGLKSLGIAIGGVVLPFLFGAWATVQFGFAESFMDGPALFMGAIMVATSVGITARVLSDINKLDTHEGTAILAAAVIDDVLGILVLAAVLGIAGGAGAEGAEVAAGIDWGHLGTIALKAFGFIAVVSVIGILLGKRFSNLLLKLEGRNYAAIAAAICFAFAAAAEMFGLAMIIGAYLVGILLSVTKVGKELEEKLSGVSNILVPIFFATMGTLVDFQAMATGIVFGLAITALAIIGKVVGSGLPAIFSGFNFLGSMRIGIGMLPRGEVALIIAGIGLSAGLIEKEVFGVSILMTIVTTLMAPIILVPLFTKEKSGLKDPSKAADLDTSPDPLVTWKGSSHVLNSWVDFLVEGLEKRGYEVTLNNGPRGIVQLINQADQDKIVVLRRMNGTLSLDCSLEAEADIEPIQQSGIYTFQESVAALRQPQLHRKTKG